MMRADHHLLAVGDRVDVDLDGASRKRSSSTGASSETETASRM
jgi:hypothetical protein